MSILKNKGTDDQLKVKKFSFSKPSISTSTSTPKAGNNFQRTTRSIGSKLKTILVKKLSQEDNTDKDLLYDHISNTLGIIELLSNERLSAEQTMHVASLKSSCDFLLEKLDIPYPEHSKKELPVKDDSTKTSASCSKSVLLICAHPLQKKILKNLIAHWGYQIQVLTTLPKDLVVLNNMNYDLVIIAQRDECLDSAQILELNRIQQDFLVLTNGISPIRSKGKKFPVIQGPIDPDYLNYKMNKIIKSRKHRQKSMP